LLQGYILLSLFKITGMKKIILSIFILFSSYFGYSQPGAALNFDGINDYVALPNVGTPFNVSSAHIKTFQLWFKNTATQGNHVRIFSTGTAGWTSGVWFGYAAGSPYLRFELSDGVGVGVAITGTTSIRGDNQWHHATGVISGTLATLYLDANYQGTVNISGEGAMNSPGSVHIGDSYDNEAASYFQGNVDEVRVWDRVLCAGEIMATKDCELTGSESGLVAYYQFNNGTASGNNIAVTNLNDLTAGANTGTLTNMALTGAASNWVSPGGVITGNSCAPFTGSAEIDVLGNSISIPDNDITPNVSDNTDFGSTCQNNSITNIFTIQNTSTISLVVSSVTITGTNASMFLISPFSATLSPLSSATIAVTFTATSTGVKNAMLVINNSDCDESLYNFNLTAFVSGLPTVVITGTNALCSGNTITLTAGGASTYSWNTGATTTSISVSPSTSLTYTVTGTAGGCINTATKSITFYQSPSISINGPSAACFGTVVNLIGGGGTTYTWNTSATTSSITVFATSTTTYSLNATDINGCTGSAIKIVIVNQLPTLGVSSTSSLLCSGSTATLTAMGANTYTWSTGPSGSSIVISPTASTNYTVTGTDANGCTNSTMISQSVADCTGIGEINASGSFLNIYPNPFTETIILQTVTNNISVVEIQNALGQLIYNNTFETTLEVNLKDKESGIYFVRIFNEEGLSVKKITKQ
jgi:hypothetical protein